MFVKSRSDWYSLDWSGAELNRYSCQWMEKASLCLCSHSGAPLQAILLQSVEKWTTGCQPKCQKCEQNAFLRVTL